MKKITIFLILLSISCSPIINRKKKIKEENSNIIAHLWKVDSCGRLHYREEIHKYLFLDNEFNLEGKFDILSLFPHPNKILMDTSNNEIIYNFIIEGYSECDYPNLGVLKSMLIRVDKKTNRVKYSTWSIH